MITTRVGKACSLLFLIPKIYPKTLSPIPHDPELVMLKFALV